MRSPNKHATIIALACAAFAVPLLAGCAHDELVKAKSQAAVANEHAYQAERDANLSHESARNSDFARFEAEKRAQEAERAREAAAQRARAAEADQSSDSTTTTIERIESSP